MIKNNYDDDELTYVSVIKNLCLVEPQTVIIFFNENEIVCLFPHSFLNGT